MMRQQRGYVLLVLFIDFKQSSFASKTPRKRPHLGSALLKYSTNRLADLIKFRSFVGFLLPAILHNFVDLQRAVSGIFHTVSISKKV